MRVLEKHSTDPSDAVHSAAFRFRLRPISTFVADMNAHLTSKVDLLAVRDGTKFDFILKNAEGKVCGVVKPLVFSNIVQGVHIETTGLPRRSSEFFFDRISAAAAAAMFEREQMGSHIPSP